MAYTKNQWIDHVLDGEGNVVQQGTPVDAEHLNHIEEGVENSVSKDGGDTINDGLKFRNTTDTKTNGGRVEADDSGMSVTSIDNLYDENGNRQELTVNTVRSSDKTTAVQLKRIKDGVTETFDLLHSGNKDSIKPEDIGAAPASHGNHVPPTETANNKKFLRNDNTWQEVTPENIEAAPKSHSHTADKISGGTFGSKVNANKVFSATVGAPQVRDIYAGTEDMTAGTSSLTTGTIYFVYE